MRVTALNLKPSGGGPAEPRPSLTLIENYGIKGDGSAGNLTRQVSIFPAEWDGLREPDGLCSRRFVANLVVAGFDPGALAPGQNLEIGGAVLAVERVGKDCYPDCPVHGRGSAPCVLGRGCVFAMVVAGGSVRVGDELSAR